MNILLLSNLFLNIKKKLENKEIIINNQSINQINKQTKSNHSQEQFTSST